MNIEHINKIDLQKYGEESLSPQKFLLVHAHLEMCAECQRRLDEMFPKMSLAEEKMLINGLQIENANDFHLNYEEHLKPFIYEKIDPITKEIVESHVEVCAECREDLRDLLNFHDSLETDKRLKQATKGNWWANFIESLKQPHQKLIWTGFGIFSILAVIGLVWGLLPKSSDNIVKNQPNTNSMQNVQIESNLNQPRVETNQNHQNLSPTPKISPQNTVNQNENVTPKEPEMANLVLPKFLKDLEIRKDGTVRSGNSDSLPKQITIISPKGKVIRDSSPVLQWQNVPNIQNYEVAVFDENYNRLSKVDAVTGNSWRTSNLPKGQIYQWQVSGKATSADNKITDFLGQGRFYIVSEQEENRINQAKESLQRGKALAEAGLLSEAAIEFRKYLKQHPNSETAKKYLRQIE